MRSYLGHEMEFTQPDTGVTWMLPASGLFTPPDWVPASSAVFRAFLRTGAINPNDVGEPDLPAAEANLQTWAGDPGADPLPPPEQSTSATMTGALGMGDPSIHTGDVVTTPEPLPPPDLPDMTDGSTSTGKRGKKAS